MATAANKVIPIKAATSWSFSRYGDYVQCPAKFKFKHVMKLKEPPSTAMARGAEIHNMAEAYVKGTLAKLPVELKLHADFFKEMRKRYKTRDNGMVVEDQWAFTKTWDLTEWNNWTECWVRIKLDIAYHIDAETLAPEDYKTGKQRPEEEAKYLEQLQLYAMAAFLMMPWINKVVPRLRYLDQGTLYPPADEEPIVYTREELPKLQKLWMAKTKKMMADTTFKATPNDKCKWCHFRKSNGGPCQF